MSYTKEELYKLPAVEIYKLVLQGKVLKRFPAGFWQRPEASDNAKVIIRYLIEEKLKLSDDELKEKLSIKLFYENSLRGMLFKYFKGSPYKAIELAYPGKFKPWEFNQAPNGYWKDKTNVINSIKWLIEDKLKLNDEQLKEQLSQKLFYENGLGGMLLSYCNYSPFEAIELIYPNRFKPWEFNQVPTGYWQDETNVIQAIKWLIADKLKLNDEQLKEQLSQKLFIDNGLGNVFGKYCNSSPYLAIELAYPGKFKAWEFKNVPMGYWEDEKNIRDAIKWLVEDKLKLTDNELKEQLSLKLFEDNGFASLLHIFGWRKFDIIDFAYPGKFKKSDFEKRVI